MNINENICSFRFVSFGSDSNVLSCWVYVSNSIRRWRWKKMFFFWFSDWMLHFVKLCTSAIEFVRLKQLKIWFRIESVSTKRFLVQKYYTGGMTSDKFLLYILKCIQEHFRLLSEKNKTKSKNDSVRDGIKKTVRKS